VTLDLGGSALFNEAHSLLWNPYPAVVLIDDETSIENSDQRTLQHRRIRVIANINIRCHWVGNGAHREYSARNQRKSKQQRNMQSNQHGRIQTRRKYLKNSQHHHQC